MEKIVIRPRNLLFLVILAIAAVGNSAGNDVYLAQAAVGGNNGADCADALVYTFFNSSSNWTSGTPTGTKIGPGTTVHICGTITGTTNFQPFVFQRGGSSGNPITLKFEAGAAIKPSYCNANGCIYSDGNSFITVNGGTNGYIQNQLNGTTGGACPGGTCSENASVAVEFVACIGCTVENLGIYDIYDRSSTGDESSAAQGTTCVYFANQAASGATNNLIQNDTIHDCVNGIYYGYGLNDSGVRIMGNTIYHTNWAIGTNGGSANDTVTGMIISGNTIHDLVTWNDGGLDSPPGTDIFHHNAIVLFSGNTGTSISAYVYNNYFYGDIGNATSPMDIQNSSALADVAYFFNNLILLSATTNTTGGDGGIYAENDNSSGSVAFHVYNNTLVGANTMSGLMSLEPGITMDARNNIVQNWGTPLQLADSAGLPSIENYNDWYQPTVGGNGIWDNNGHGYTTLSSWQSASGLDLNSVLGNPLLNANGTLKPGSPATGLATNLSSICSGQPNPGLGALCFDKAGNPRPSTGNWDAGAYVYTGPASGLTAAGY
jgi:hypothetical protein